MNLLEEVAFCDLWIRAWPIAHWEKGKATGGKTLPNSGCSSGATVKWPEFDRRLHGPRTMRIGARDAALTNERRAHEKRAERVTSSPDASWGRSQIDMQPKNLDRNRSTDRSDRFARTNTQIITEGNYAGTVVTGPDAEDVHVLGGVDE